MKPHIHRDVIIAWANGYPIEMKKPGKELWVSCTDHPMFLEEWEYRVKTISPVSKDYKDEPKQLSLF